MNLKRSLLVILFFLFAEMSLCNWTIASDTKDSQTTEVKNDDPKQKLEPLGIKLSKIKLPKQIKAIDFRVGAGETNGWLNYNRIYSIGIGTELKLDQKFDFHKIDMKIYHFKQFGDVVNEYALDWLSCIKLKRTNPYCFLFFGPSLNHLKRSEGGYGYYKAAGDSYSTTSYIGINSGLGFNSIAFGSFLLGGKVQCHYLPLGKSAHFYKGKESYPQRQQLFDLVMQMEAGVVVTKHAIIKITGEIRTDKIKYSNTIPAKYEWSNWRERDWMLNGGIEFRF